MMTLEETAKLMLKSDYKQRFIAEYWQLRQRYDKLNKFISAYPSMQDKPKTPMSTFCMQLQAMSEYRAALEARAAIEDIELKDDFDKEQEQQIANVSESFVDFFNSVWDMSHPKGEK